MRKDDVDAASVLRPLQNLACQHGNQEIMAPIIGMRGKKTHIAGAQTGQSSIPAVTGVAYCTMICREMKKTRMVESCTSDLLKFLHR